MEIANQRSVALIRRTAWSELALRGVTHPFTRDVLVPLVATRAALFAVALVTFRLKLDPSLDMSPNHLLSALSRWDGNWYLHIAQDGYTYTDGEFHAVAFAPLLPLLMRILGPLFGGGADGLLIAGVLAANLALIAACAYLVALVRLDDDEATARRSALYLLVFPTSFFLSAVYPESLFLALAIASFYYARRDRWVVAGVLAALCALARPHGVLIAIPLSLEYLHQHRFVIRAIRADAVGLVLPLVSFGAWLAYQYARFGDALAFIHAQAAWQRVPGPPWAGFLSYFTGGERGPWNDLLFALLFVALVVVAALTQRPSYALFAAIYVLVPLSTGQLYSMMRIGLSIFPLYIALARFGKAPLFDRAYVPAGLTIGGAFMTFFVTQAFFLA
jgi:hypothetical protein